MRQCAHRRSPCCPRRAGHWQEPARRMLMGRPPMRALIQRCRFTLRRVGLVVVVLATCMAVLVPTANAAKPIRNPFIAAPPTTFPAGLACPFELFYETV